MQIKFIDEYKKKQELLNSQENTNDHIKVHNDKDHHVN